jgi:hypothetical protein
VIALLFGAAWAATHIDGALTVQVSDRDAAIAAVVARAEKAGGWFSALSDDAVTVQVPVAAAAATLDGAKELGQVVDRSWGAQDLDSELVDLNARLASRQAVLQRYLDILGTTNASAVVSVEREITRTVSEIEQIEGRIRYLQNRGDYAQLAFSFRFRDRAAPSRDGSSSFAWLNTLNLSDLQDAFRSGVFDHHSGGVTVPLPAGFAPSKKARRFAAVSPDDVVMRVRTAKNKPKADLAFWKEAMRTRMTDAGYHVVKEDTVRAGTAEGALLELSAPDGEQDDTYLVVVFVDGKKLVVVEAAGEVGRFAARREAILAAVGGMEI